MQLNIFLKYSILFGSLISVVDNCMRTGGGGGGDVSRKWLKYEFPCNLFLTACSSDQVTFTPRTVEGTADSSFRDFMQTADGGATMVAVCPVSPNGGNTFMQFNTDEGGPRGEAPGEVTALLTCTDGVWTFTQEGVTRRITEVNCIVN